MGMDILSHEQFRTLATRGVLVPVYRELAADLETPVSVYLKLRGQGPSFLLESVEKAEQVGRYSFLGFDPRRQIMTRGREVTILDNGQSETRQLAAGEDPLHAVAAEVGRYQPVAPVDELGFHTMATNSAKMALYTPSHSGLGVRFGTLETCIEAALDGTWV